MLLYDVTSDRSFLSVRQWIDAVDVSIGCRVICPSQDCFYVGRV